LLAAVDGAGCIRRALTALARLEIENSAVILKERAPGVSVEEVIARTSGKLVAPDNVPDMVL
jgi:3-oxoacid CoA-transferase subunit B